MRLTFSPLLAALALLYSLGVQAETACAVLNLDEDGAAAVAQQQSKAEAGDACAQFNLGFYRYTQQDYVSAEQWYRQAAEQGNARAAFEIAILYRDGLLDDDDTQSGAWMEKSANLGLDLAQIELGIDQLENRDDEKSLFNAMEWFEKAANQGNSQAQYLLSQLYWSDERGAEDMAMGEEPDAESQRALHFASSDEKAAYWLCKAAQNDNADAQYAMAQAYNGRGDVPIDSLQRRLWMEKAAANGNKDALPWLDDSNTAWYTVAENWVKRQLANEEARCPDVAQQPEQ